MISHCLCQWQEVAWQGCSFGGRKSPLKPRARLKSCTPTYGHVDGESDDESVWTSFVAGPIFRQYHPQVTQYQWPTKHGRMPTFDRGLGSTIHYGATLNPMHFWAEPQPGDQSGCNSWYLHFLKSHFKTHSVESSLSIRAAKSIRGLCVQDLRPRKPPFCWTPGIFLVGELTTEGHLQFCDQKETTDLMEKIHGFL